MIGVDISDRSIKVVQLSGGERRRLLAHSWRTVPEGVIVRGVIKDAGKLAELLTETLRQGGLAPGCDDPVVASIPEADSFLRVVEIPPMDESEVGEAVRWEVAQHIPFGLDKVYIDWQWVDREAAGGRQEVLVGAAEKEIVDRLTSVLAMLDLDVAALELESQAFIRSLIAPDREHQEGLLVVDLGGSVTNVVIFDEGTIRFSATLHRGAYDLARQMPPKQREQAEQWLNNAGQMQADKPLPIQPAELNGLAIEVRGMADYYLSQSGRRRVSEVVLTGGGANAPGLDQAFLQAFDNVHVQRGNPWINTVSGGRSARPPLSLAETVHYSTAIGLALRPMRKY